MRWLLVLLMLTGCKVPERRTVEADLFSHDVLPIELCGPEPTPDNPGSSLWNYGVYRVVQCTPDSHVRECLDGAQTYQEYRSYCDQSIVRMKSMTDADMNKWADLVWPPSKRVN